MKLIKFDANVPAYDKFDTLFLHFISLKENNYDKKVLMTENLKYSKGIFSKIYF